MRPSDSEGNIVRPRQEMAGGGGGGGQYNKPRLSSAHSKWNETTAVSDVWQKVREMRNDIVDRRRRLACAWWMLLLLLLLLLRVASADD